MAGAEGPGMETAKRSFSKGSFVVVVVLLVGCASTPRRESITAFRVFDVKGAGDPSSVAEAAQAAMAIRADNLTAVTGTVPEPLPEMPPSFRVNIRQLALPF